MQRHRYSFSATIAPLLVLGGTTLYGLVSGLPAWWILLVIAIFCYIIWKLGDGIRNKSYRKARRQLIDEALDEIDDFHADERYDTPYNGLILLVDNTREELILIDQKVDPLRLRFDQVKSVSSVVTYEEPFTLGSGTRFAFGFGLGSLFGPIGALMGIGWAGKRSSSSDPLITQVVLFMYTTLPDMERIHYIYFDAYHGSMRTRTAVSSRYKVLVRARGDMDEVERRMKRVKRVKKKQRL